MRRQNDNIDYLDLTLRISPSLTACICEALSGFKDRHLHIEVEPKLKEKVLLINSTDLIAFTGYINPALANELDLFRFKSEARTALEQQLVKSLSLSHQAHYKWCIAALENKEFGRYEEY